MVGDRHLKTEESMNKRKVIVFIAASIDGFIATKDDGLDFLSIVEAPPEDYGYAAFVQTVDTVVIGRKTYDKVLSFDVPFPHAERKTYVISTTKTGSDENVNFWNDSPASLIQKLQQEEGIDIFVDGGASIIQALLKERLIDKMIVSTIPHLLGDGIRLFGDGLPEQSMQFIQAKSFPSGLVQVWYEKK